MASTIVEGFPDATEGFAFCLSEHGDLLSQWRAYANNGTDISIGFSPKTLVGDFGSVNFGKSFYELVKVNYGEQELRLSIQEAVEELCNNFSDFGEFVALKDGVTKDTALKAMKFRIGEVPDLYQGKSADSSALLSKLLKALAPLHFRIYETKPHTFFEECEWRLLRYRHRIALPEFEFFADDGSIKPFITCLIAEPAKTAIQEIVLGPKHQSHLDWMHAFLNSVGLEHVQVRLSELESFR